ncbi:MAG: hypothetical protein H6739_28575 [Alphaproteobacteria bacterium]|nr:hypothetical protein [Alphaproteobacteria bacterium]
MNRATPLLLAALAAAPAWAQDDPEPAPEAADALDALEADLAAVREALAGAQASGAEAEARRAALAARLEWLSALIDDEAAPEARSEAARSLAAEPSPADVPFLDAAVRHGPDAVAIATLDALAAYGDQPRTLDIGRRVMGNPGRAEAARLAAIRLLGRIPGDDAGRALYAFAVDDGQPTVLREAALAAMREGHAALLAELGEPAPPQQRSGPEAGIGVAANTMVGGVLLSSVGAMGQSDVGVGIGGVGGSLIGLGTGLTYVLTRPVSLSNNLQYASGAGWGLDIGVLSSLAIYGDQYPESRPKVSAALRAVGTGVGAGVAYARFKTEPEPIDLVENNVATWIGQQVGFAVTDMVLDAGNGYNDQVWDNDWSFRAGGALTGAVSGGIAGYLLRNRWTLEGPDAVFGGVTFVEATWIGAWVPIALKDQGHLGAPRLAGHLGAAGAFALAEAWPVSTARSLSMGYGGVAGAALGAGVPLLGQGDNRQLWAASILGGTVLGSAAGFGVGDRLDMQGSDYALVYVGLPLVLAETGALSAVAAEKDLIDGQQVGGLLLTAGGVGMAGLLGLGQVLDPETGQVVVTGTAAAWGAWYGVLTPLAFGADLEPEDRTLIGVATADTLLVAAVVAQSPAIGLQPRSTLFPQLGGVSGATLGALIAGLATSEPEPIAGGAVAGSLVGFGAGAIAEWRVSQRRDERVSLCGPLPRPQLRDRLPGDWGVTGAPWLSEDGAPGVQVQLYGAGF